MQEQPTWCIRNSESSAVKAWGLLGPADFKIIYTPTWPGLLGMNFFPLYWIVKTDLWVKLRLSIPLCVSSTGAYTVTVTFWIVKGCQGFSIESSPIQTSSVWEKAPAEKGWESSVFGQASFLTQACGLTDPVVSSPAGQVILRGLLPGHLSTGLGSDAASVLTQLRANPRPLCLHLDMQITLFKMCLLLSKLPRFNLLWTLSTGRD